MITPEEKRRILRKLSSNPNIAFLEVIEELKESAEEEIKKAIDDIKEEISEKESKKPQSDNSQLIEKTAFRVVEEIIKDVKGERGENGRNPLTVSDIEPPNPQIGDLWYQP